MTGKRCPFCPEGAVYVAPSTADEVAHMEAEHPDVIVKRLENAGIRREFDTDLSLIGRERVLADNVARGVRASVQRTTDATDLVQTHRGAAFEILVVGGNPRDRDRVYRIEVTLKPMPR